MQVEEAQDIVVLVQEIKRREAKINWDKKSKEKGETIIELMFPEAFNDMQSNDFSESSNNKQPNSLRNSSTRRGRGTIYLDPGDINIIPNNGRPGSCCKVLYVAIGTKDSAEKRILEAIKHFAAICKGRTELVILYTARPRRLLRLWDKHKQAFENCNISCIQKIIGKDKEIVLFWETSITPPYRIH
jgi:hypothetical protein